MHPIIEAAQAALNPRAGYARDVLAGYQRWSGSDLKGKARRYGGSYAVQRSRARAALFKAGGCIVAIETGRLVTGVNVGQDDYGNTVYWTVRGVAIQATAHRARRVYP